MKKGAIVERIQDLLTGLKCEWLADVGREPAKFGRADAAVLKVAMAIAALDGNVTDAELKAFERLAKKCRGYNAEAAKAVFLEGLKAAGYIELAARTLKDRELLAAFVAEAERILPSGFAFGDAKDVRRAFVMWTAMAMSDNDYSDVERKALTAFRKHLDAITETVNAYNDSRRSAYSPAFARAFVLEEKEFKFKSATTDAFMEKAEKLIAKLNREATAEAAAQELKDLIVKG